MYKQEITLKSIKDVSEFVHIATTVDSDIWLTNPEKSLKVTGKSLLGAMATVEWNTIVMETSEDLSVQFEKFIKQ